MKNFITFGNHKLGDDTAIFNMGPALTCPAKELKMCQLIATCKCYAEKAEILYGERVIQHRKNQGNFWKSTDKHDILQNIFRRINARKKETRYLRFNESGDFSIQADIEKLSYIAEALKTINIVTYGYTARYDLDYRDIKFLVKGSGWNREEINGTTTVIGKNDSIPEGFILCPGKKQSCATCNLCKVDTKLNIAFRKH